MVHQWTRTNQLGKAFGATGGVFQGLPKRISLPPIMIYFCIASISLPLAAQTLPMVSHQDADLQSWDEMDASTRLSHRVDVIWIARGVFSVNLPNPADYLLGTDWNFSLGKNLVITPSYHYFGFRTASGTLGHGQSPILGITPVFSRGSFTVSDRNRFCGRFGTNGIGPSWDYRNRPQIEYRVGPSRWGTSLFMWDEIFYYSKYSGWTKNRAAAGGRKGIGERLAADHYFQRENNEAGQPARTNTIAFLLELRIR